MTIIVEEIIMRIVCWVLACWGIELELQTAVFCMRVVIWLLAVQGMQSIVVEMEDGERRVRRAVRAARAELQATRAQEVRALQAQIAALRGARGVEHLLEEAHARDAREVE
jgi:hypothetical protein